MFCSLFKVKHLLLVFFARIKISSVKPTDTVNYCFSQEFIFHVWNQMLNVLTISFFLIVKTSITKTNKK